MEKININDKLNLFNDYWNPRVVAELNGQHVKLAKLLGEFPWHKHVNEDEMFLVIKGAFTLELRDREIKLNEGEFIVVPRGVEHRPVAEDEVSIMLFEPVATLNTGDIMNEFSKHNLERI